MDRSSVLPTHPSRTQTRDVALTVRLEHWTPKGDYKETGTDQTVNYKKKHFRGSKTSKSCYLGDLFFQVRFLTQNSALCPSR